MDFFGSPAFFQILIGIGSLACFVVAWLFFDRWKIVRALPTSPINRVHDQLAEVKGRTIEGDIELVSPLSQQPCVYYSVKVERYRSSGRSGRWVTEFEKESGEPIYFEDGTGQARAMLFDARLEFKTDYKRQAGGIFEGSFPPHVSQFLQKIGVAQIARMSSVRCKEIFIEPGEDLYVLGWGKRKEELVEFTRRKPYPLIVSDFSENRLLWHYLIHWVGMALSGSILAVLDYLWITAARG